MIGYQIRQPFTIEGQIRLSTLRRKAKVTQAIPRSPILHLVRLLSDIVHDAPTGVRGGYLFKRSGANPAQVSAIATTAALIGPLGNVGMIDASTT